MSIPGNIEFLFLIYSMFCIFDKTVTKHNPKKLKFKLTEKHKKHFDKLKQIVFNADIMAYY